MRHVQADPDDARGLSLLGDIYRDLLVQVASWLNRIFAVVNDPRAAARKAGWATEGHVDLTIGLSLKPARQLKSLVDWAEQRTEGGPAAAQRQQEDDAAACVRRRDYDLVALLLAAFGLGWLFGDDGED